ncbi:hypothetical protein [Neoroseomonas rubea]|uniref:hypothetical protein n=1 Tax=Neoroseomonas rubea TaxID=2748666 RepID=UPI0018DF7ED0|nr:hypothetical protein [Roseomonas rubea]
MKRALLATAALWAMAFPAGAQVPPPSSGSVPWFVAEAGACREVQTPSERVQALRRAGDRTARAVPYRPEGAPLEAEPTRFTVHTSAGVVESFFRSQRDCEVNAIGALRAAPPGASASSGEGSQGLSACRDIADGAQRLACYDRLTGRAYPMASSGPRAEPMTIIEYMSSRPELLRQVVSVFGYAGCYQGGICMLHSVATPRRGNYQTVLVGLQELPAASRQRFFSCDGSAECGVVVSGLVMPVITQGELIARDLQWAER